MVNKDSDKSTTVRVMCSCGERIFERSCHDAVADWMRLDHALYAAIHEAMPTHPPPAHHLSVEMDAQNDH